MHAQQDIRSFFGGKSSKSKAKAKAPDVSSKKPAKAAKSPKKSPAKRKKVQGVNADDDDDFVPAPRASKRQAITVCVCVNWCV